MGITISGPERSCNGGGAPEVARKMCRGLGRRAGEVLQRRWCPSSGEENGPGVGEKVRVQGATRRRWRRTADGEKGPQRSCKGGGSLEVARKMCRGLGRR
eukprot:scaffold4897_cov115-Amphora_coffeaeformis.AAC.1